MSNLRVAELDFDTIKQNLKTFLQDQDEFTDFDFEGAGISILLDILAYNTHYNAYLANMNINEMFLDSAVKRNSAVSIAKHLGYTPRSTRGATAIVDITVNNPENTPVFLTLPRFTPFTTTINDTSYTFLNIAPVTIQPVGGVYQFQDIEIKQGKLLQFSYTVAEGTPDEKFVIPNNNVDTTTLYVTVQTSGSDLTGTVYNQTDDISSLDGTSKVFFLEESPIGQYQIYFGDGVLGKALEPGNIINIQYLVTEGTAANVSGLISQSFTSSVNIGLSDSVVVTTVRNSTGGADRESISSIKFNAYKANASRYRLVTKEDYSALIKREYPIIQTLRVWGGEENDPPVYGKVYISMKPFPGSFISDDVRDEIKNTVLRNRQMLTVIPEFVDPEFLYIKILSNVKFDSRQTNLTASQIQQKVITTVNNFFSQNLGVFDSNFYASKLIEAINECDNSIVSNITTFEEQRRIEPILNVQNAFINENVLRFNNSIDPGSVRSTKFFILVTGQGTTPVRIRDIPDTMPPSLTGTGTLYLYNVDTNATIGVAGTVDYLNGVISLNSFVPVALLPDQFDIRITATLQKTAIDIETTNNQIIVLDDSTLSNSGFREQGLTVIVNAI